MSKSLSKIMNQILNPVTKIAGLDIGLSSVKFMEIEGTSVESCRVVNYAIEYIPREYYSPEGRMLNVEGIAEIIKKCWKKSESFPKDLDTHFFAFRKYIPTEEDKKTISNILNDLMRPSNIDTSELLEKHINAKWVTKKSPPQVKIEKVSTKPKQKLKRTVKITPTIVIKKNKLI